MPVLDRQASISLNEFFSYDKGARKLVYTTRAEI